MQASCLGAWHSERTRCWPVSIHRGVDASGRENLVFGPLCVKLGAIGLYVVERPVIFFCTSDRSLTVGVVVSDH
jgi:hypothetical protein